MGIYNVYCDESCHLEHDNQPIMAFGAIWCSQADLARLSETISKIKRQYKATGEMKWTKVSKSREDFYLALIDWFFREACIHFRATVILNKQNLNHGLFNENSHDTFYYKMYFSLLSKILSPENKYHIYLDIKDTRSRLMKRKLKEILCNNVYDFTGEMIGKIQHIHSHESHFTQLADLFLGALTYKYRNLSTNATKLKLIEQIESKLIYPLTKSTPLREEKFNLFLFTPQLNNEIGKKVS